MASGDASSRGGDGRGGDGLSSAGVGLSSSMGVQGLPSMHSQPWQIQNGSQPQSMHSGHWSHHTAYPLTNYHVADQQRYSYVPPPVHIASGQELSPQLGSPAPTQNSPEEDPDSPDGHDTPGPSRTSSRVLKQTRRAEQNRQAQRAFRQRKENRIAELEKTSQDYEELKNAWHQTEARRAEVEERARTLAERALALDARERNLPLHISHATLHAPIPDDLPGMRTEIENLRAQLAQREEGSRNLRMALEDISSENKALREQLKATRATTEA